MSQRRIVNFANSAVAIEWAGNRAHAIVDFLFRHTSADENIPPHVTFRLVPGTLSNGLALYRDETRLLETDSDAELAEFLLGDVSYHLVDKSRGGIVLHAGALAWKEHGILVPGAIGAGKTTLTAWLVTRGLDYLTDEMVWIPDGSDSLHAFTRPLNVKTPSRLVISSLVDFEKHATEIVSSDRINLIPPNVLKPDNTLSTPRLSLILFPNYQSDDDAQVELLSKAQAGFALLPNLMNVGNLFDHGFAEGVRLAQSVQAYCVRYSCFAQIAEQIEQLLRNIANQPNA